MILENVSKLLKVSSLPNTTGAPFKLILFITVTVLLIQSCHILWKICLFYRTSVFLGRPIGYRSDVHIDLFHYS